MNVDTRVYGYQFEDHTACASCAFGDHYTHDSGAVYDDGSHEHGAGCEPTTDREGVNVPPVDYCERQRGVAVFSSDDDGYGLTCDDCYESIFETHPEVAHAEYGDHDDYSNEDREQADCEYCADYLEDHATHAGEPYEQFEGTCDTCGVTASTHDWNHTKGDHVQQPDRECRWCRPWFTVAAGQTCASDHPTWSHDIGYGPCTDAS